jgi:hypothetical protein
MGFNSGFKGLNCIQKPATGPYHNPDSQTRSVQVFQKVDHVIKKTNVYTLIYLLYKGRVPYSFLNYVLYYKIPYYSSTLISNKLGRACGAYGGG